jgi:hypothetical protein
MKKQIILLIMTIWAIGKANAQILTGSGVSLYNNDNTVAINGNFFQANPNTAQLAINANTNSNNGASIFLWHKENTYNYKNGSVDLCSYGSSGHGIRFVNYDPSLNTWIDNMVLYKNGKVVIGTPTAWGWDGTTTPGNYKLYVESGILTEKIKVAVKTSTDWADYVFKKGYSLMPLQELEQYISVNHHLPGVPSADEMVKNGNDLVKTDAKLLEKVEELTLYIIELNKQIKELKKENMKIQTKLLTSK